MTSVFFCHMECKTLSQLAVENLWSNLVFSTYMCVSAYDGPYENSPESPTGPQSHVTKINVTPDSTKTEETDSDNDIPTIPTGC